MLTEEGIREQHAWLGLSEAARVLGCSAGRVRQLADSGKLVCSRTPLGRVVDARSVYEFLATRPGSNRRGRLPVA